MAPPQRGDVVRRSQHVANAEAAVLTYCERVDPYQSNDPETNVGDLVADLMHYCEDKGLQWDEVVTKAAHHYEGDPTEPDFNEEVPA